MCKEFKFGTVSEMFIGRLSHYYEFLNSMKDLLEKYGPGVKIEDKDSQNEFFVDEVEYEDEFFLDVE